MVLPFGAFASRGGGDGCIVYMYIYVCLYTQHSEDVRKMAASHSAWRPLSRNLPAEARTLVAHRGRHIPFGPLRASLRAAGVGRAAR